MKVREEVLLFEEFDHRAFSLAATRKLAWGGGKMEGRRWGD